MKKYLILLILCALGLTSQAEIPYSVPLGETCLTNSDLFSESGTFINEDGLVSPINLLNSFVVGGCVDDDHPDCSTSIVPTTEPTECVAIPVDLSGASNSPFSINSGADRWYSFVASSTLVQVSITNVNAPTQHAVLGLYDDDYSYIVGGDFTTGNTDDDALIHDNLTLGEIYYVSVEEWNVNPSTMTADICIINYPGSECDLPPSLEAGPFTIQSQLKASYNAAANGYRLVLTSTTSGIAYSSPVQPGTWVYIAYTGVPNLPDTYTVRVESCYSLSVFGFPIFEYYLSNATCTVDVGQFDTYLVSAHNCSNKTWALSGRPRAAPPQVDVASFTWKFEQTMPFGITAWDYTTPTGSRKLPAGGLGAIIGDDMISTIDAGATYNVSIRANYIHGSASDFGPVDCLVIAGASGGFAASGPGEDDDTFAESTKSMQYMSGEEVTIYPNPSNGDFFNLNIPHVNDNKVLVDVLDLQGRTIRSVQLSAEVGASFNRQIALDNLSTGLYLVRVIVGNSITTNELSIMK